MSLAIGLSGRPISSVARIWADGRLIRSSAGRFGVAATLRVYRGTEDQTADPALVAALGAGAPAYRGLSYVVLEDLSLRTFRGKIPTLSFEVVSNPSPASVGAVAADVAALADIAISANPLATAVTGYASTESARFIGSVLADIGLLHPFEIMASPDGSAYIEPGLQSTRIEAADLVIAGPGERAANELIVRRSGARATPVQLSYIDVERDYQPALSFAGEQAGDHDRVACGATLTASQAKTICRALVSRSGDLPSSEISLPVRHWSALYSNVVAIEGTDLVWRATEMTFENYQVSVALRALPATVATAEAALGNPAAPNVVPDQGDSTAVILDVPKLPWEDDAGARVLLGVSHAGPEWAFADVLFSPDGLLTFLGRAHNPLVIGRALASLSVGPTNLLDRAGTLTVKTEHNRQLESCSRDELAAGANMALVGSEIIQFADAQEISSGTYRLTTLIRGRFGTEHLVGSHASDERFILLDKAALLRAPLAGFAEGTVVRARALGPQDSDALDTTAVYRAADLRPYSPAHLDASREPDGAITIRWVSRSRLWSEWGDQDDGIGDFLLQVTPTGPQPPVSAITRANTFSISAVDQGVGGWSGALIEIRQRIGSRSSPPAIATVSFT